MASPTLASILIIPILLSATTLLLHTTQTQAHNITAILDGFPDYALYNSYLSKTKVCDEINAHETVTCLVLSDAAMTSLVTAAKQSLAGIKNALRLLSLLDYFDPPKLHDLPSGTTLTTTLYQTTGNAAGNLGFVNITNLRGGKVGFAAAAPGSKFDASYVKSVREMPFNLSIIEISDAVIFPGLFDATASTANITALLEKAGCKTFASLIASSGVLKIYQTQMADKGLTLFAPNDDAFQAPGAPDLSSLSSADLVTLLQYHALPQYTPKSSLSAESGPIQTLASNAAGKYEISVVGNGDDVSLDTGVGKSRVASTVLDDTPNTIMTVDSLLLPVELFGGAPSPAPGPAVLVPAPAPAALAPAPGTKKHRLHHSPPAPPMEAPADAPAKAASDKADVKKAAAAAVGPMGVLAAIISSLIFVNLVM